MTIKLRKKKLKDNSESLYLDIYDHGVRRYEFLNLKLAPVKTPGDRQANREIHELAQKIRTKREHEANHEEYNILSPTKAKTDFITYFQSYIDQYKKKDLRMFKSSKKQFEAFLKDTTGTSSLPARQLTEDLLQRFRDRLEEKFSGETPHDYFSKLKQVVRKALKEGIVRTDPIADIKNSRGKATVKDVLTFDELSAIAKTETGAPEVKKAFLFCCLTGLRWCDVKALTWSSIKGDYLHFVQAKTGVHAQIQLHHTAQTLIGRRGAHKDLIFLLPSSTAANKAFTQMVLKAEINKHITWHCARHSFGTNILFYEGDILSASKLLGHSSLTYTQRYVRAAEQMKQNAIRKLPIIELTK